MYVCYLYTCLLDYYSRLYFIYNKFKSSFLIIDIKHNDAALSIKLCIGLEF